VVTDLSQQNCHLNGRADHWWSTTRFITGQPTSLTVQQGDPVSFTVTGGGSGKLTYQWKRTGPNVGTNNPTYAFLGGGDDTITPAW